MWIGMQLTTAERAKDDAAKWKKHAFSGRRSGTQELSLEGLSAVRTGVAGHGPNVQIEGPPLCGGPAQMQG